MRRIIELPAILPVETSAVVLAEAHPARPHAGSCCILGAAYDAISRSGVRGRRLVRRRGLFSWRFRGQRGGITRDSLQQSNHQKVEHWNNHSSELFLECASDPARCRPTDQSNSNCAARYA